MESLTLAEELLLLSLRDEEGTVVASGAAALPFGLAGAVLMDLSHARHIDIEDNRITVLDTSTTGDAVLDAGLRNLALLNRARDVGYWVARPDALVAGIEQRLLDGLVARGILRRQEKRLLWVLRLDRYPTRDAAPEADARRRMDAAVFHGVEPDPRTASLLCLTAACGLGGEAFPEADLRTVDEALLRLTGGDALGRAMGGPGAAAMVEGICAAVVAAAQAAAASMPGRH